MENFKKEIVALLRQVDDKNFSKSYGALLDIVLKYKEAGLDRDTAIAILSQIDSKMEMNDYQEDVFLELSSRVEGFSSDANNIPW